MPEGATKVLVAMADVDALVRKESALDEHARQNTTSVYTAAETLPMLPEKLPTDLTSLNHEADRLAIVVELGVASDGSLRSSDVHGATVRSRAKLAYNSVAAWLEGDGPLPPDIRIGTFYYTQAQYSDIVAYARDRCVTMVPEIDMPGHTNAALASYPELNCNGVAPGLYAGTEVGFSLFCLGKLVTADFVLDVIGEIASLTPGPYCHIGGDETPSTDPAAYAAFVEATQDLVNANGKRLIGWEEVTNARLVPGTVVQQWDRGLMRKAVQQGARVIFSPSKRTSLDMKYDRKTRLGQDWAGHISVRDAYEWDPATCAPGVAEGDVLGVEAPLWTETLSTIADLECMAFPRLMGIAEIGWSSGTGRSWDDYRDRLGAQGPRLENMGVRFYRAPGVPWM